MSTSQQKSRPQSHRLARLTLAVASALGLLVTAPHAKAQNLVVNGGFETGNFTGWTQFGNTGATYVDGSTVHSGSFAANFGPVGSTGGISQNIHTFAGGSYTLTYFLDNDGGTPNSFSSKFNGATLSSITNGPGQPYTQYTFSGLLGTGTSTPLAFTFQQNPNYWHLDDVSLILNSLRNSTMLNLGTNPTVLSMTNNFSQTSTGVLQIKVGGLGAGQSDLITAGGTAALNGTLQLVRLNNFSFQHGDKLTFLIANQGVSGEFSSISSPFGNTILAPVVVYGQNSVSLEVQTFSQFASNAGLSPNETSVAGALDSTKYVGKAASLINYLDNRPLSKLPGDFDRISPDQLTSIFNIGTALSNVQSGNIQRRNDDIRSGSSGFSAQRFAMDGSAPSYSGGFGIGSGVAGPSGDDGKEVKETKEVAPAENRWGAFLSGTGEWVSVGNTDNARGYDLTSGGFTLGVDYKVTPNLAIGLAAGYTGTTADLTNHGRVWVNGGKIGLYGTFFQNNPPAPAPTMSKDSSKDSKEVAPPAPSPAGGFYADFAVFGGYNSYDTRRSALQGDARGDTDGGELDALFGAGYDFKKGAFTFGPTASFNYTYIGTNGFNEHDSLAPLDIHGAAADSLRTAFGIKASYDWKCGSLLIKPEIRAAWQHEYGDAAYDLTSNFANGTGSSFTVAGPQIGRDSALLGAGFAVQINERLSTYFYYDGELGRKNYQATAVTGGIRAAF